MGLRQPSFDALTTSGLPADFQVALTHPGNTAVLTLTADLFPEPTPPAPPLVFPINPSNVGHAIDDFFNNGGTRCRPHSSPSFGLTGGDLGNALSQLSGELLRDWRPERGVPAHQPVSRHDARSLRQRPRRSRQSALLGFAPERDAMPPELASAYAAVFKAPLPAGPIGVPRWNVWGGSYGGGSHTAGDAGRGRQP